MCIFCFSSNCNEYIICDSKVLWIQFCFRTLLLLLHSFLASDISLFIASYLLANKHAEIYLTFRKHCRLLVLYYCLLLSCSVVSNSLHPLDCSTPGFPVFHHLLKLAQTHVHWIDDAIQPSHPLSPTSPPALNLSQHQGLFQWVSFLHQVIKVLELQLQHRARLEPHRPGSPRLWPRDSN